AGASLLMRHHVKNRDFSFLLFVVLLAGWTFLTPPSAVAQKKQAGKQAIAQQNKPVAPPAPRSALLTHESWQKAPLTPLQPGEIDQIVAKELQVTKVEPASATT